jgi:hypothetical protein
VSWSQWTTTPDASGNIYTNNSGNVGIGTTTPWSRLDIRTNGSAGTGYYGINLQNPSTAAYSSINLNLASGSNSRSLISSQQNNTGNGAYLFLQTTDATGTMQPRMTLSDAGNVGIGLTSPVRLLDLSGTGNWSGSGGIRLQGNNPGIEITDAPSGQRWLIANGVVTANDGFLGLAYNFTTSTHNIVVTKTNNVGIGTYTPGSNKLAVEGTIAARKVIVTATNPFPDYVFDPAYPLPSLDSVANYIRSNRHLSEIPSADSVAKSGLDLGGNQTALLRKIEELTLYAIAQKEQLGAQAKAISEQDKKLAIQQQEIDSLKAAVKKLLEK